MKHYLAAILISVSFTPPVLANEAQEEANKKLVVDFYNLALNDKKPAEAMKKYGGKKYIQHNPFAANGAEAFVAFFEKHFKQFPNSRSNIIRVVADGDLVVLHVNAKSDEKDRGSAVVDILRVENGKIVEHWDVVQPVPEKTVSGNSMF